HDSCSTLRLVGRKSAVCGNSVTTTARLVRSASGFLHVSTEATIRLTAFDAFGAPTMHASGGSMLPMVSARELRAWRDGAACEREGSRSVADGVGSFSPRNQL